MKQKTQVPLTAHTFSGGRMLDELNAGIAEAVADTVAQLNDPDDDRTGARTVTLTIKVSSDGKHVLKTSHKVDVKLPRVEVGDRAFIDGDEVLVDLRVDPGTNQLDMLRTIALNEKGA